MFFLNLQYYCPCFFAHSLESRRTMQAIFLTSLLAFLFFLSSIDTRISKETLTEEKKSSLLALASAAACSFLKSC